MAHKQPISVGVGGLICNAQGQILLIERLKQPDIWTLPSGYVEPGETLYQTLQRELQEETGIAIQPYGVVGVRQRLTEHERNNCWILIRADFISGVPQADMTEVSRVSFFDIPAALSMPLTPVTRHVLVALLEDRLPELQLQSELSKGEYLFFC